MKSKRKFFEGCVIILSIMFLWSIAIFAMTEILTSLTAEPFLDWLSAIEIGVLALVVTVFLIAAWRLEDGAATRQ